MSAPGRTQLLLQVFSSPASRRQHMLTAVVASTAPSTAGQMKEVTTVRDIYEYTAWLEGPGLS